MNHGMTRFGMVLLSSMLVVACGDDKDDAADSGGHDHADGDHDHDHDGDSDAGADEDDAGAAAAKLSVFVTSDDSESANLGGLSGADSRCNKLAKAVGSKRKFAAYLSAEKNAAGADSPIHARDRIGDGPWYNAKGVLVAQDLDALHDLKGNADLFLDETGAKINGQWDPSKTPNEHDILTGSDADGRLVPGKTCGDWTSTDESLAAQVGHSDGLGPNMNGAEPYSSWNSAHESESCKDTRPRGGAGKVYCFAAD
jgi:hypothetical protein